MDSGRNVGAAGHWQWPRVNNCNPSFHRADRVEPVNRHTRQGLRPNSFVSTIALGRLSLCRSDREKELSNLHARTNTRTRSTHTRGQEAWNFLTDLYKSNRLVITADNHTTSRHNRSTVDFFFSYSIYLLDSAVLRFSLLAYSYRLINFGLSADESITNEPFNFVSKAAITFAFR